MHLTRVILLLSALLLTACGTVSTLTDGGVMGTSDANQEPEKLIMYQGVTSDIGYIVQHGEWYRLLDFPLSFAADTILLPYTIPAAFIDNAKE